MTEPSRSGAFESQLRLKLHDIREVVDAARWGLLDAVILVNEITETTAQADDIRLREALGRENQAGAWTRSCEQARARRSAKARLTAELTAVDVLAGEPNHEDYVPNGDRP